MPSVGGLDLSFGGSGKVTTDFGSSLDQAQAIAVQADGKIVVVGTSGIGFGGDFAVARYNADGSLDAAFDGDGKVTTDFGNTTFDEAHAVALQADGKIVVAGFTVQNATQADFALVRYQPDGSLDPTFGSGGKVTTDFVGQADQGFALAIYPHAGTADDGKIVVAGFSAQIFTSLDFALARYNPNGSLDPTFGAGGKVTTDFGGPAVAVDLAHGLALQADGKIVVVGESVEAVQSPTFYHFALARFDANGSLDPTFGAGGKVTTDFGNAGGADQAFGVAIQPDDKIVVAGISWQSTPSGPNIDFALARYNVNGSLDASFDADGKVLTDFFGGNLDRAFDVALQADGKIIVAGDSFSSSGTGLDFALARYNPSGSLDTSFDGDGKTTTDFAGDADQAFGIAIQADGKIVAAGPSVQSGAGSDFALARYVAIAPNMIVEQIEAIIPDVQALVAAGALNQGQGWSLLVKLQAAIQQLDSGHTAAAKQLLKAFVAQARAFIAAGILTAAQGQPLIDEAEAVIALLGGNPLLP